MVKKRYWFRRKIFGWGWFPNTWEGWLVTILFIFIVFSIAQREPIPWVLFIPLALLLIFICYKTGEKPRWNWGR